MKLTQTNGTSLLDIMSVGFDDLIEIFGEPAYPDGDGYKTDKEWEVQTPHGVATIYNWKDGENYNGVEGMDAEHITEWHIGGHNIQTARYIQNLCSNKTHSEENNIENPTK